MLEVVLGALLEFRKGRKKVIAFAEAYGQALYAVAAAADEIWLHPFGAVVLEGLGRWRVYYKDGIDRLGVNWHIFRVGEYKSAVEPYLRNGPSPEAREADSKWLADLWSGWLKGTAAARRLNPEDLSAFVDRIAERAEGAGGNLAQAALDAQAGRQARV